jgi:hypothetical protein
VNAAGLTDEWIAAAKRQLASDDAPVFAATLRHSLGFAAEPTREMPAAATQPRAGDRNDRTVLLGAADAALERELTRAGFRVSIIPFTPFDAAAAGKVGHFETYNRTAASQRVADIVAAVRAHPGAPLVADGDAALAGLLATAIAPVPLAVLGVGPFDTSNDADYVSHVYIPGLRRAGDFQTAASMSHGNIVIHDAGPGFSVRGLRAQSTRLTPSEIAALVRKTRSTRAR